jgi:hypothetical protein
VKVLGVGVMKEELVQRADMGVDKAWAKQLV